MLGVLGDIDGLSVILDGEGCGCAGHLNCLDWIRGGLGAQTDRVIVGIHQQFVHELVEARIEGHLCILEVIAVTNKDLLGSSDDAADIGIGKVEDVLAVRLALVVG